MILTIFVILVVLSFFLVLIGYWQNDMNYRMVGFLFLFLLSWSLINDNLEYQSTIEKEINNTYTEYNTTVVLDSSTEISTKKYSSYDGTTKYGIYLAIASLLGFVSIFLDYKDRRGGFT